MGEPTGLAPEQLGALGRLKEVPLLADFYLGGGAAVAAHLDHRRSLDKSGRAPQRRGPAPRSHVLYILAGRSATT